MVAFLLCGWTITVLSDGLTPSSCLIVNLSLKPTINESACILLRETAPLPFSPSNMFVLSALFVKTDVDKIRNFPP